MAINHSTILEASGTAESLLIQLLATTATTTWVARHISDEVCDLIHHLRHPRHVARGNEYTRRKK